jgi:hypothetical protein
MRTVTSVGSTFNASVVRSALLLQVLAWSLCAVGCASAVDWRGAGVLLGAGSGAEVIRWMLVGIKLLGISLGIACWWYWRGLLRKLKSVPDRCSACLYPTDRDRCPECGVEVGKEPRRKSLAALQQLQTNHFADMWSILAFLILIRVTAAGAFIGVSAIAGALDGAVLRRWSLVAGGASSWIWIEAPIAFVSLVLVALGLRTLRRCENAEALR